MRYKLIFVFSFILSIYNTSEFFQPPGSYWGDPSHPGSLLNFGLTAVIVVIFSIGFSLAILMPQSLQKYFNRNYTSLTEVQFSEEELKNLLKNNLSKNK